MASGHREGQGGGAAAVWPAPPAGLRLRAVPIALGPWLGACVAAEIERRRLFPWIAVAYGAGIVLASVAEWPVSAWPPLLVGTLFAAGAIVARAQLGRLAALIALAAVSFGFAALVLRTRAVETPVLARLAVARLEGFVESLEERKAGGRLVIRVAKLDKVAPDQVPVRVRVTARTLGAVAPGDYVAGTARLLPLPEPARPGGYDFARDAYFRGLGAVGSITGRLAKIEPAPVAADTSLRTAALVDRARNALTRRIADVIGGQPGAVAAALITGKRGLIDDHSNDVLRAAGIYHIVSISGLHMVLAAGVFFWLTRAVLALSPALALTWPIKKIAALAGMAGATAYDIFSGSDIATERSLVMILVMQGAILFDRPALSIRNLALAALICLTRAPETLLGPSFQMSFAAVAGLIALAEWMRRWSTPPETADLPTRAARWLGATAFGTVATTAVATAVTGPFGTYHFQNLQPYGLIGNAATLPLVSFVVMPCAVVGTVLYPFGLDRPVWTVMGWGVEGILRLSEWVAGLSGSITIVPAFGEAALLMFVAAILLGTLFVSVLRWFAAVPAALALLMAWASPRPDVYIGRDGTGAAIRGVSGRLLLLGRSPAFEAEQWLKADGDARRASDPSLREGLACDPIGCVVAMGQGRFASLVLDRRGFEEDCRRAALIVSRFAAPPGCAAAQIVDGPFLREHGATTLRQTASGFAVASARRPGDTRPWFARPAPRPPPAVPAPPAQQDPEPETPSPDEDPAEP